MFYPAPLALIANPHTMLSSLLNSFQTFNLARDDDSDRASSPVSITAETETSSIYSLRTRMEGLDVNSNVPTPAQELETSSTYSMRVKMDALHIDDDISLPGSFELHVDSTARGQPRSVAPSRQKSAPYPPNGPDPSLETFLTAATLTSTENMPSHHHKLFSSSAEFHHTASEYLPEKLSDLTITDVVQSVERVVKSTYQKAFRPSDRFGRLSVRGFEQAKLTKPPTSTSLADATPKHELDELRQLELLSQRIEEHHCRVLDENLGRQTQDEQCRVLDEALAFAKKGWNIVGENVERQKEREQKAAKRERIKGLSSPGGSPPSVSKLKEGRERARERIRSLQAKIAVLYASKPTPVDAGYVYDLPIEQRHEIHQVMIILAVVCNMIIGLSSTHCDFIIGMALILVKMAMSAGGPLDSVGELEQEKLKSAMPKSVREALRDFDIDGRFQLFAACPRCHFTNPSLSFDSDFPEFPETCSNEIVSDIETRRCDEPLLQLRRDNSTQPIKPYLVGSFKDYLARCTADPTYLSQSLQALCKARDARRGNTEPDGVQSVFEAEFFKDFHGPDGRLFSDCEDKIRLAFSLNMDFFRPHGMRVRGNQDSIGIISSANLALNPSIRYLPEYMFIGGIVPGPHQPSHEETDHYVRPIIEQFAEAWRPGIRLSRTADPASLGKGALVECAVLVAVNDLPAARSLAGMQGHTSMKFLCSVCKASGKEQIFCVDPGRWERRDCAELRRTAESWRDSRSSIERDRIYEMYGIRWSSMWLLEYWDPTRMLVIDSMHCILEGLVHYHCRHVLRLDAAQVKLNHEGLAYAFDWPWTPYDDTTVPSDYKVPPNHIPNVYKIHDILSLALGGEKSLTLHQVWRRMDRQTTLDALRFVVYSLEISDKLFVRDEISLQYLAEMKPKKSKRGGDAPAAFPTGRPATTKAQYIALLMNWRLNRDFKSQADLIPTSTPETLEYIQRVVKDTVVPSWVNSVPKNFGEAKAGTLKADEWRTLSSIYLPIALVTLWDDSNNAAPSSDSSDEEGLLFKALDHTMALFQATIIACRYTMTPSRARAYRDHLSRWVTDLRKLYPFTREGRGRPNIHAAGHLYDFLLLFGPVISWWCFPFERLIGALQKINTNEQVGGVLERTLITSQARAANIRRWLRRQDCPEIIKEVKLLFDKSFVPANATEEVSNITEMKSAQRAYVHYDGVKFSPKSTHAGNSNIIYRPSATSRPVAGQIELIQNVKTVDGPGVRLHVRRHAPLPATSYDPFRRYPHFQATTYSSRMSSTLDEIDLEDVVSHAARFDFSGERCVYVNLSRD